MPFCDYFGYFDPSQPYHVSFGELPHWEQEGATYFITFRTADSLPRSVWELARRERDDWLYRNGIDVRKSDWQQKVRELPYEAQREFQSAYVRKLEIALDKGHGDCPLRDPKLAQIVADSLLYFDGFRIREEQASTQGEAEVTVPRSVTATTEVRYHVSDLVVMPNHVHVMVCFLTGVQLRKQCESWKRYTAVRINRALLRTGMFWQEESFDHMVRDGDQFERFRGYIGENRKKAGLTECEGLQYRCADIM